MKRMQLFTKRKSASHGFLADFFVLGLGHERRTREQRTATKKACGCRRHTNGRVNLQHGRFNSFVVSSLESRERKQRWLNQQEAQCSMPEIRLHAFPVDDKIHISNITLILIQYLRWISDESEREKQAKSFALRERSTPKTNTRYASLPPSICILPVCCACWLWI